MHSVELTGFILSLIASLRAMGKHFLALLTPECNQKQDCRLLKSIWNLIRKSVRAWIDDYAPSMGAALAYYTLFSIAPLLIIAIAVAGLFFGQEVARGEIVSRSEKHTAELH